MVQINSYEQFAELRSKAVRLNKFKHTNFLVSTDELRLHIANERVFFEEIEKCLCVVIKIRKYDYLYFWCADEKDTFLPEGVENIMLAAFTNTEQNNDWSETAQKFGMHQRSKLLQVSGKTKEFTYPQYPSLLRSNFKFNIITDYTYDYYAELAKPYFDYENDIFVEEYIWNALYKYKLKLAEVRTNDGDLAAFCSFSEQHKTIECYLTAVIPKYRGLRLQPFSYEEISRGYEYFKTWIQDRNSKSWRVMSSMGIKKTNNYRILYGIEN